jgi:hypothetical protein
MANVESYRGASTQTATKLWQQEIGVTADGVFGPATEAATKKWQSENGLTPDGIVGSRTWGVLLGVTEFEYPPTLKINDSSGDAGGASSDWDTDPVPVHTATSTAHPSPASAPATASTAQPPKQPSMGMFSGNIPLLTGVALIGAAFYAQVLKNRY